MSAQKPKRLSLLLGLYLLISVVGFSASVLVWTYHSAIRTINLELGNSFEQKHTLAESIMERQLESVEQTLREIRRNEFFSSEISRGNQSGAEDILYEILDSDPEQQLDILFLSLLENSILADVSSPFFDAESVLTEITGHKTDLLSSGRILRFGKDSADLTIMLRAVPVIRKKNRQGSRHPVRRCCVEQQPFSPGIRQKKNKIRGCCFS